MTCPLCRSTISGERCDGCEGACRCSCGMRQAWNHVPVAEAAGRLR